MTKNVILRRLLLLLSLMSVPCMTIAYDSDVDVLLEGTLICSGSASKAALAFDGDASTYYSTGSDMMQWVGLDLGEPHVITRINYMPAPNSQGADRMLLGLFEGANSPDFMDAMPLHFIASKPNSSSYARADVGVSRGFRYIRYVGGAGSYCNVAELQFYGHPGEGDDSHFYQITNLPTLSIHVRDNILPSNKGEDFESQSVLIYENGTMIQEYPVLFRVRGNYSASHENKAFRIKYNDGKSHHMMRNGHNESPGKCKKWVLINSYRDKTLMRNPVAWAMSRRAERDWTPWSQVVDLVVNGDYRGTYTLADAVSVDRNRIDITEMSEFDTDEETITGGYLVEADNNYSKETYHFLSEHSNTMSVHEPDEDVMQPEQFQYIKDTWNNMENIVFGAHYADSETGLRSVLDMETFLRWFLTSEFNGNTDMICQVFHYKERSDDHFYTGPIWDADLALENDETTYPANERMDWTYKVRDTGEYRQFVSRVLSDQSVFAQLRELWASLRKKGNFNPNDVAADVDSLRAEIRASANLNFIRWPYLNQWLSLNPAVPGSWEAEVDRVRDFVRDRVLWMDQMLSYGRIRQEDGVYQIATGMDLCIFSKIVNELGEPKAKGALIADIDMADCNDEFQPIGTTTTAFTGSLDGKGHVIRNLHISGGVAAGLVAYPGACTLTDIVFDETCSVEGTTNVGMLCGYARNGVVDISRIENHGTVTASGNCAAALVGCTRLLATVNINDCCNTGSITAESNAAAFVGPSAGRVAVANSYNTGTISGATEGKEFAFASKSLSIENCWDYTSMQTNNMTPAQVDNGELCFLLNNNGSRDAWRQNLDNGKPHDALPVLNKKSGKVYGKDGGYTNINVDATKFRYYNLVVTKLQGGSYGTIQFCEFDLLDDALEEIDGLNIYDGPAGYNNEGYENATDNNVYTKYCGSFSGNSCFLFDAGSEVDAFGYRIYTANDTRDLPERNPSSWKLYGSNTLLYDAYDSGWTLIDERENDWTMGATNYTPYDFLIPHVVQTIALNQHSAELVPGEELQLEFTYTPEILDTPFVDYTSSDENVATVDDEGKVVAVGVGTADIVLSVPSNNLLHDTCRVTVIAERPGHRYYQLAIDEIATSGIIQLCEFDLLDKDGNEVVPLSFISATGTYIKDHDAGDLFDDNINTKYCASFTNGVTLYIYIDAGRQVELSGYRMTTAADTQKFPGRNPVTWSLLGSNTRSEIPEDEGWVLLDRRENDTTLGATNFTPYDFFFTYPQPVIPGDVNGDGFVNAADYQAMQLYIIGKPVEGFVPAAADLNSDGKVNAQDLVKLTQAIGE